MCGKVDEVLKRIDSRHLSELWGFYRDYFSSDALCIDFLYGCIKNEPIKSFLSYREVEDEPGTYVNDSGEKIKDDVFIPRRMLNLVERLVTAARDMELIRKGKDVFKIVFLVTCVETLQQLSGKDKSKKELLFSFFDDYVSEEDKNFIRTRFWHNDVSTGSKENSFQQFVGVINEYRNCAAHEGAYWDYCFNNNFDRDECPLMLIVSIDLEKYSMKNKREYCFQTQLSYSDFEAIFVRTCIRFIEKYIEKASLVETLE